MGRRVCVCVCVSTRQIDLDPMANTKAKIDAKQDFVCMCVRVCVGIYVCMCVRASFAMPFIRE